VPHAIWVGLPMEVGVKEIKIAVIKVNRFAPFCFRAKDS